MLRKERQEVTNYCNIRSNKPLTPRVQFLTRTVSYLFTPRVTYASKGKDELRILAFITFLLEIINFTLVMRASKVRIHELRI
jgi:hypothetical protein